MQLQKSTKIDQTPHYFVCSLPLSNIVVLSDWAHGLNIMGKNVDIQQASNELNEHLPVVLNNKKLINCNWLDSIPKEVKDYSIKTHLPYTAMKLITRCEYTAQLMKSSPVLLYLLVDHAQKHNLSVDSVNKLVKLKRTDQLKAMGVQCNSQAKSMIYFLQRLDLNELSLFGISSVTKMLRNGSYKNFSHFEKITVSLLKLYSEFPYIDQAKWFYKLSEKSIVNEVHRMMTNIISIANELNFYNKVKNQVIRSSSIDKISDISEMMYILYLERHSINFPKPPVPGTEKIKPITNAFDLYLHGVKQHNCVFDYIESISAGKYYIFSIDGYKQATLGVEIDDSGKAKLDQVLAAGNKAVNDSVKKWLSQWLEHHFQAVHHMMDYKWESYNNLMNLYHDFNTQKAISSIKNRRFIEDYKQNQINQLMSDYCSYCQ